MLIRYLLTVRIWLLRGISWWPNYELLRPIQRVYAHAVGVLILLYTLPSPILQDVCPCVHLFSPLIVVNQSKYGKTALTRLGNLVGGVM